MPSKYRAKILIVTFHPGWNGPARLPALLHRVGAKVDLLAPKGLAHRSRYVHSLPDKPTNLPELVRCLREHMAVHGKEYDLVLLGDDSIIGALCQEEDPSWMVPWFPVDTSRERVDALYRKDCFSLLCQQHGLLVPENRNCRTFAEVEAAATQMGYPVVLKENCSFGGLGVRMIQDFSSLRSDYFSLADSWHGGVSVQQYIPGRVGGCHVLARRGEMVHWHAFYKTKTYPGRLSAASQITSVPSSEFQELSIRVARTTGYHGIFGFDWIESNVDRRIYVLELNPRAIPPSSLGKFFGLNVEEDLPLLWNEGRPPPPPRTISRPGTLRLFPLDILRCLDEGDRRGLWSNIRDTCLLRNDVPWREPALLFFYCRIIFKKFLRLCIPVGYKWTGVEVAATWFRQRR